MLWASTRLIIIFIYFHQFAKYIDYYYGDRTILAGRKEMEFMANFCAFQFWQHIFKVKLYALLFVRSNTLPLFNICISVLVKGWRLLWICEILLIHWNDFIDRLPTNFDFIDRLEIRFDSSVCPVAFSFRGLANLWWKYSFICRISTGLNI